MFTLPLGAILLLLAVVGSMEADSWGMYLQGHALTIVLLGTVAVLIFSNPTRNLKNLFGSIMGLFKPDLQLHSLSSQIKYLTARKTSKIETSDPLLKYASDLWDQGVDSKLFETLLKQKKNEILSSNIDAIVALKNLAKYPPALGMTGTVVGLVTLFNNLGSDRSMLGGALALAMTATFLGLIIAHALIMPLADRLDARQVQVARLYNNLFEIILLIDRDEASTIILDEVDKRAG